MMCLVSWRLWSQLVDGWNTVYCIYRFLLISSFNEIYVITHNSWKSEINDYPSFSAFVVSSYWALALHIFSMLIYFRLSSENIFGVVTPTTSTNSKEMTVNRLAGELWHLLVKYKSNRCHLKQRDHPLLLFISDTFLLSQYPCIISIWYLYSWLCILSW